MIRTYSELMSFDTFLDRFKYLSLRGKPGDITYGFDRYLNQQFYQSTEWRRLRNHIILRDNGCDLGIDGHEIHAKLLIHHMNPMQRGDGFMDALDPEFLITTTHRTHNAIHYGDESLLPKPPITRMRGDTKLW
jgi:hypothetical protein